MDDPTKDSLEKAFQEPGTSKNYDDIDKHFPAWGSVFNAIDDWVSIIDTRFFILKSNKAVEKQLNIPINQVVGKTCYTLVHNKTCPAGNCPMPKMLASKKRVSEEIELPDGRWIQVTLDPIKDKSDKILWAVHIARDITHEVLMRNERKILVKELKQALGKIRTLSGLIPICSSCKNIRDDRGYWNLIESYIETHSHASFSHGICPDCIKKMYGNEPWYKEKNKDSK